MAHCGTLAHQDLLPPWWTNQNKNLSLVHTPYPDNPLMDLSLPHGRICIESCALENEHSHPILLQTKHKAGNAKMLATETRKLESRCLTKPKAEQANKTLENPKFSSISDQLPCLSYDPINTDNLNLYFFPFNDFSPYWTHLFQQKLKDLARIGSCR